MTQIAIEIGNVESRIVGNVPSEITEYLRACLSFEVQGAENSEKTKPRRLPGGRELPPEWDGRKYLITEKRHVFSTGLLPRVLALLNDVALIPEISDQRTKTEAREWLPLHPDINLYDYQRAAVDKAILSKLGTIRVGTGGGKTRIGCAIVSELERPALFLVHRRDLMNQILDVLRGRDDTPGLLMFPEQAGQIGNGVCDPRLITVATVQTIAAAMGKEKSAEKVERKEEILECLRNAEVVIVDECHHTPADTVFAALQLAEKASYRIGLSATDWRDDNADLMIEAATGPRIVDIPVTQLIDWGVLVPAHIETPFMAEIAKKSSGFVRSSSKNNGTYHEIYRKYYAENEAFHSQVLAKNQEWLAAGRTILTLVTSIEHGEALEKIHQEAGIHAVFIRGESKDAERTQALDDVRAGKLKCLIATSIADEGLDLPALDALNLAGGGKSSTRAYQRIGRVIRAYPGKTEGLVVDWRCPDHRWLDEQFRVRMDIYKREKGFILT